MEHRKMTLFNIQNEFIRLGITTKSTRLTFPRDDELISLVNITYTIIVSNLQKN